MGKKPLETVPKTLVLGASGAGKTSLVQWIKAGIPEEDFSPVIHPSQATGGLNMVRVTLPPTSEKKAGKSSRGCCLRSAPKTPAKGPNIILAEIGGQMQPIWQRFFNQGSSILYVVDSAGPAHSEAAALAGLGAVLKGHGTAPVAVVLMKADGQSQPEGNIGELWRERLCLDGEDCHDIPLMAASATEMLHGSHPVISWLRSVSNPSP